MTDAGAGAAAAWSGREADAAAAAAAWAAAARGGGAVQRWLGRHGHEVFHPLVGADLPTLAGFLLAGPRPTAAGAARLGLAALTAAARLPLDLADAALDRALPAGDGAPEPPPLFIVGHWRSGTTHLHNLLSRSPRYAWPGPLAAALPWTFRGLGPFLRRRLHECLPPDRLIDAMPLRADAPQEEELALANMGAPSFYRGIFFPRSFERELRRGLFFEGASEAEVRAWRRAVRLYAAKLGRARPGRRLLLKNPAHTGRLDRLLEAFPDARVILLRRNPFAAFESARAMLRRLLGALALEPWAGVDVDGALLRLGPDFADRAAAALASLPPGRAATLAYEDLEARPLAELERLHAELDLPGYAEDRPLFERHLRATRAHRGAPHAYPPDRVAAVRAAWGPRLGRPGYAGPP